MIHRPRPISAPIVSTKTIFSSLPQVMVSPRVLLLFLLWKLSATSGADQYEVTTKHYTDATCSTPHPLWAEEKRVYNTHCTQEQGGIASKISYPHAGVDGRTSARRDSSTVHRSGAPRPVHGGGIPLACRCGTANAGYLCGVIKDRLVSIASTGSCQRHTSRVSQRQGVFSVCVCPT